MKRHDLARAIAASLLAASAAAHAQDGGPADPAVELDTVVVTGDISYRDRTDDTAPVLVYGLEYFQRFEPSTVGDMLKRVPSAVFVSDVLEYDGVQLRGLDPSYTQVLINGRKVPGAGDDRSFWVDRIPAELVDRIEILRSNSANRSGDAVAGALNIVLRDAYEFDGSYIRVGAMRYDDGEVQPTIGAVTSFEALGGRLLAGISMQDRYNPKLKRSDRYDEPGGDFDSAEDQTDTRDGQDWSGNLSYTAEVGATGRLSIDGFYVKTDRDQVEVSTEYDAPVLADASEVARVPGLVVNDQANWGIGLDYAFDMAGGRTKFDADHARFEDDSVETEEEHVYEDGAWQESKAEKLDIDSRDAETSFSLAHERPLGGATMEFGVDYRRKEREMGWTGAEFEQDEAEGLPIDYTAEYSVVDSLVEETRVDPYLMFSGKGGALAWEAGLRYETTKSDMAYRIAQFEEGALDDEDGDAGSKDYDLLLPSLHLKWNLTDADRLSLSLARSLRRPNFRQITPVTWEGEFEDNDLRGNPQLDPETANGIDLGYERRLGRRGVFGVNVFYRDVQDLIEVFNTGEFSDEYEGQLEDLEDFIAENPGATQEEIDAYIDEELDAPTYVYTTGNVGDGKVWGVEFDLSTPLTALGLPDTGVFLNYSWLDSKVDDFMGERRFNNQARSVYNVGFIHDLPQLAASFGASYRKQGEAFSRILAEEVLTTYDADLEVFVEKRFGDSLSVRLSGTNLLDADKRETFHKFATEADQLARDHDEYEVEAEHAGPRYQLVLRYAF